MSFAVALALAPPAEPAKAYSGYQFPCSGYSVVGYYFAQWVSGWGHHLGEDVCGGAGRAVYAAADGVVMYSALTPETYRWGNLILIQHDHSNGTEATGIYGHLSNDRRVSAGQTVSKGQLIGFTAPSYTRESGGWAAHLHFGVKTGPYGAGVGTYSPSITGYSTSGVGAYAHPTNVVNANQVRIDYQLVGVTGNGTRAKNSQYYIEFHLKNTGTETWYHNGATPMKLGTSGPRDRLSGFSTGMLGQGWSSANRIAMLADTPPGGVGVFRAIFNNGAVPPGMYAERFTPVIDGRGWLADKDLWLQVGVRPPQYSAQWAGQNVFTTISPTATTGTDSARYLLPGQRLNAKVYVRNTGDYAWTSGGPNPVRLGTARANDRNSAFVTTGVGSIPASENWLSNNRPSGIDGRYDPGSNTITPTGTINPGEIGVFSFAFTAPNQPGTHREYFQPVAESLGRIQPDMGIYFDFRVLPPGHHYEWVTQANPAPIQLGRTAKNATVYLRNVGQSNWSVDGDVRLGTDRSRDRASAFSAGWISPNRAAAIDANATNPDDSVIRPGNVARFQFNVQSESVRDGNYQEYFRPVVDGSGWMPEDYGIYVPITVSSPARDYKVLSETFSTNVNSLQYGETFDARLAVRNLGTSPWTVEGASPVRLGTSQPLDRGSGFNVLTGSDPWLSVNRATKIDGKVTNLDTLQTVQTSVVNQGEVAYLNIPLKVPNGLNPGPYNEHFNFVQDGQSWFPDLGIYFPLNVTGS